MCVRERETSKIIIGNGHHEISRAISLLPPPPTALEAKRSYLETDFFIIASSEVIEGHSFW